MRIWGKGRRYRSRLITYFMAFAAVFITLSMVQYPKEAFDSAIVGLNLWWNVVFPSLLPFFILSEILMGLGVVHFIGVLLEPLMRPVFNVPGVGAFALSMGLASGYPMDAVITSKFRKNQLCTAVEAERLLSFTNTADPLFMFGAVAVGMFARPELGAIIALAHYISSFLVGVVFRFHGRSRDVRVPDAARPAGNILLRAFRALYNARQEDKRSIGQLLGDAVRTSMNTILLIGGFIIVFSVFLRIVSIAGLTGAVDAFFVWGLGLIGFSPSLAPSLVSGLFEIDIGAMAAAQAAAPLGEKAAITSAIIAWSGLSVHAQVASIVIESGIRMGPYMVGRLLHTVMAALITLALMSQGEVLSRFWSLPVSLAPAGGSWLFWLTRFAEIGYQTLIFAAVLMAVSLTCHIVREIRLYGRK